ncbi:MAG: restriction endonuclease subunit S [Treponema sp.]|nr:restriction endonuclease subunit S [Treponema sp.]
MKQSGIDWIGEIPDDWNVNKIDSLYTPRNTKVSDKDYPPLSVTMQGIVPQLATAAKSDDGDNRKLVKKGDFAINSRSDRRGSSGVSSYDGSVSLINTILTPRGEMNPIYYNWLFHTIQFEDEFYKWGHGIVDDLWTTRWQDMKNIYIVVPPKATQQRIAEYLDSKCAQIESIIEESKKSIEEYKAWKQSVIFEAVTGKNLNCKKKDSGIEWIGEIPEKYIKTRLKYLLDIKGRIGFRGYTNADMVSEGEGAITLSPSNLKNLKMDFSKKAFVSWKKYNESPEIQIKIDDILFVKTGSSYGKSSLVDYLPVESTINPQLVVFKNIKCNQNFLIYYLQTNIIQNQVENIVIGGTIPTMSQEKMKNMFVFLPPLPEQESIAKMLDSKCAQIDSLIAEKESLIADLTEYKKSLIFEVVTGKRSV